MDVCELLLSHGAVLDPSDLWPMFSAADACSVDVIEWLCCHGMEGTVNMHNPAWGGETPLHIACSHLQVDVAQCLYDHGAHQTINQPNKNGHTPLCTPCSIYLPTDEGVRLCAEMVEWLCNHGARECINERGDGGWTPLLYACSFAPILVCDALFMNGAVDTVSTTLQWMGGRIPLDAQLWAIRRFGDGMSDEAIAMPFHRCIATSENAQEFSADAQRMLRRHGPRVVQQPLRSTTTPDAVLETAVRVGVPLKFLQDHSRLGLVLGELVQQRRVLMGVFLFGCRKPSGSTHLWRLGSQHLMAGMRKAVAEYLGMVWKTTEWGRVLAFHSALNTAGGAQ